MRPEPGLELLVRVQRQQDAGGGGSVGVRGVEETLYGAREATAEMMAGAGDLLGDSKPRWHALHDYWRSSDPNRILVLQPDLRDVGTPRWKAIGRVYDHEHEEELC